MKQVRRILFLLIPAMVLNFNPAALNAGDIAARLAGRILLQVEKNGEAWYVNPESLLRSYLGRPADALKIMREQGVGITDSDLNKIPVGIMPNRAEIDPDNDGLHDRPEEVIGTEEFGPNTDHDGLNDSAELSEGKNLDPEFSRAQRGKIFIQVERKGEAWYVNPSDEKRYFLGRPQDALDVMRSLGIGIADNDLEKIIPSTPGFQTKRLESKITGLINQQRQAAGLDPLAANADIALVARRHSQALARENEAYTGIDKQCNYPFIHHEGFSSGIYSHHRLASEGIHYFSKNGENIALMPAASFRMVYTSISEAEKSTRECEGRRERFQSRFSAAMDDAGTEEEKLAVIRREIGRRQDAFQYEKKAELTSVSWKGPDELAEETVEGWMSSPGHRENILNSEFDEGGIGAAYVNGYAVITQIFIKRADCGYFGGPCCRQEGYLPYCYKPLECEQEICR